jgi:predicted Rdx family selenoprotein
MFSNNHHAIQATGYTSYFYNLRYFLEQQPFSSRIKVVGKRDMIATGRFEVTVKETKETIHSKKAGMGWPTTNEKKRAICDKINEALLVWDKQRAS